MQKERPLSPFMFGQVYKPQLTSMLSITHRGTGIMLMLGLPVLICWLASIASGPDAFASFQSIAGHWFAKLLMLGWTFSLFYHLGNGIRHLFWDIGSGFEISEVYRSGWIVVAFAIILTVASWVLALGGAA